MTKTKLKAIVHPSYVMDKTMSCTQCPTGFDDHKSARVHVKVTGHKVSIITRHCVEIEREEA